MNGDKGHSGPPPAVDVPRGVEVQELGEPQRREGTPRLNSPSWGEAPSAGGGADRSPPTRRGWGGDMEAQVEQNLKGLEFSEICTPTLRLEVRPRWVLGFQQAGWLWGGGAPLSPS